MMERAQSGCRLAAAAAPVTSGQEGKLRTFIATCWSAALNSAAALSETVSGDTVTSRSVSSRRTTGDGTGRAEPARSMVTTSCRKTNSASLHRCRCTGYHCITVCDYDGEQGEAKPPPEAHHVG